MEEPEVSLVDEIVKDCVVHVFDYCWLASRGFVWMESLHVSYQKEFISKVSIFSKQQWRRL